MRIITYCCILSIFTFASCPSVVSTSAPCALTASSIALATSFVPLYWKWNYNFLTFALFGFFSEPCHRESNITGLERALKTQLYGQHLVTTSVLGLFKGHAMNPHPSKPLVLAFHGATGVGKNLVSRMIAESLFEKGMKSSYVHLYMAPVHFPHKEYVTTYQQQLQDWVRGNITLCSRSIFIFDEVDKMHPDILNSITSFINNSNDIKGGDFNRAIYILLSNIADSAISKHTYNHLMRGKRRSELKLKEMQEVIVKYAYNDEDAGGLWRSELISKGVISAYVPFLPLELEHVKECIRTDIRVRGLTIATTEETLNSIAEEMQFWPTEHPIFSVTGCKSISDNLNYVIQRDDLG